MIASSKYVGLWHGGINYSHPDDRHLEPFDSIAEAGRVLQARADNNDGYTPCADAAEGPSLALYRGQFHDNGPDVVLTLGPRGGVQSS